MLFSFLSFCLFFFFNDTATTEIYTLSLHDALPICSSAAQSHRLRLPVLQPPPHARSESTRLNSSHTVISYAVFCLKKKKKKNNTSIIKIKKKKKKTKIYNKKKKK